MLAIADAENNARPHYGGTMLTVLESASVVKVHRVVDGQQRLTTVSILLARIAEILGTGGKCGKLTSEGIRLGLLTNPRRRGERRRKLRLQDGDDEEYRRIIERDSPESGDGAVSKAWRLVSQSVDSSNVESLIEGLNRLRVITIGLEGRDDAQQIFESLNATGMPLTEGEKVKNWLLMGLSEEVQNGLHDEYWLAIEKTLGARRDADRIDLALGGCRRTAPPPPETGGSTRSRSTPDPGPDGRSRPPTSRGSGSGSAPPRPKPRAPVRNSPVL